MPLPERGYADLSRARVEESNTSKIGEGWKEWGGGAAGVSKAEDKLADHGIFATNVGPAGALAALNRVTHERSKGGRLELRDCLLRALDAEFTKPIPEASPEERMSANRAQASAVRGQAWRGAHAQDERLQTATGGAPQRFRASPEREWVAPGSGAVPGPLSRGGANVGWRRRGAEGQQAAAARGWGQEELSAGRRPLPEGQLQHHGYAPESHLGHPRSPPLGGPAPTRALGPRAQGTATRRGGSGEERPRVERDERRRGTSSTATTGATAVSCGPEWVQGLGIPAGWDEMSAEGQWRRCRAEGRFVTPSWGGCWFRMRRKSHNQGGGRVAVCIFAADSLGLTVSRAGGGATSEKLFKVSDGYGEEAEELVGTEVSLEHLVRLLGRASFAWCVSLGVAPSEIRAEWLPAEATAVSLAPAGIKRTSPEASETSVLTDKAAMQTVSTTGTTGLNGNGAESHSTESAVKRAECVPTLAGAEPDMSSMHFKKRKLAAMRMMNMEAEANESATTGPAAASHEENTNGADRTASATQCQVAVANGELASQAMREESEVPEQTASAHAPANIARMLATSASLNGFGHHESEQTEGKGAKAQGESDTSVSTAGMTSKCGAGIDSMNSATGRPGTPHGAQDLYMEETCPVPVSIGAAPMQGSGELPPVSCRSPRGGADAANEMGTQQDTGPGAGKNNLTAPVVTAFGKQDTCNGNVSCKSGHGGASMLRAAAVVEKWEVAKDDPGRASSSSDEDAPLSTMLKTAPAILQDRGGRGGVAQKHHGKQGRDAEQPANKKFQREVKETDRRGSVDTWTAPTGGKEKVSRELLAVLREAADNGLCSVRGARAPVPRTFFADEAAPPARGGKLTVAAALARKKKQAESESDSSSEEEQRPGKKAETGSATKGWRRKNFKGESESESEGAAVPRLEGGNNARPAKTKKGQGRAGKLSGMSMGGDEAPSTPLSGSELESQDSSVEDERERKKKGHKKKGQGKACARTLTPSGPPPFEAAGDSEEEGWMDLCSGSRVLLLRSAAEQRAADGVRASGLGGADRTVAGEWVPAEVARLAGDSVHVRVPQALPDGVTDSRAASDLAAFAAKRARSEMVPIDSQRLRPPRALPTAKGTNGVAGGGGAVGAPFAPEVVASWHPQPAEDGAPGKHRPEAAIGVPVQVPVTVRAGPDGAEVALRSEPHTRVVDGWGGAEGRAISRLCTVYRPGVVMVIEGNGDVRVQLDTPLGGRLSARAPPQRLRFALGVRVSIPGADGRRLDGEVVGAMADGAYQVRLDRFGRDGKRRVPCRAVRLAGAKKASASTVRPRTAELKEEGCARARGFRPIPWEDKQAYLQVSFRPTIASADVPDADPLLFANGASKESATHGRASRAAMRKQTQAFGASTSDAFRFNQLNTRARKLSFRKSAIHGWGLYADEPIPAESIVIEYRGLLVSSKVCELRERIYERQGIGSSYMFRINKTQVIDATHAGGPARYINHSCDPNCYTRIIALDGKSKVVLYAKRQIEQGEELSYDYNFPPEDRAVPCHCGAAKCRGYMA